jgi:hypothetical protein
MTVQLTPTTPKQPGGPHDSRSAPGDRQPTAAPPATCGRRQRTAAASASARRRALLAAFGFAMAATILPAAAHASPQPPAVETQFANPGGNPQPPQPPDPPAWGPEDLANATENPEPPQPPNPPAWGPEDLANPTENPEPPQPPKPGVGGYTTPTDDPDPVPPGGDPIPTPQRVDAGFGGITAGSHQAAAGLALVAAALVLALLVVMIARRHRSEAGSDR